jgi:hypothetical protein
MSLLDNVKQTVKTAAGAALEVGQNLGAQAQAQVNIKKLQVDKAKKLHQLGVRTYEWHQTGNLVVSGPVPDEIQELCLQLDSIGRQLDEQQLALEEAKRQAEERNSKTVTAPAVVTSSVENDIVSTQSSTQSATSNEKITSKLPPDDL